MFMKNFKLFAITLILPFFLQAQTIGTIQHEEGSQVGYTFFSPFSGTKAYLVDNCGRLINEWSRGTRPGLAAYFLDNGLMFRTYKVNPTGPFTSASNAGGLEFVDWDNNTVWQWELNTPTQLSHHDAVYMPNGNVLVLTWELVYTDDLIEFGRDPNEIAVEGYMWSERILELAPDGSSGANIVWEWNIKDHYIQDFDSSKLNYGVVSEHPELFNINLPDLNSNNSNSTRDWNHFNAIDYNPDLDQILISVRNSDEIWILDHSTTTAEAASHTGGIYGKGGDLLYRWGNGSAYERAPTGDQKFFGQHGVHWIKEGLADAGKILIFNNGNGRPGPDYSTTEILEPPMDSNGGYILPNDDPFGPEETEIVYGDLPNEDNYSPYLSNAQRLDNGNTLLNYGSPGRFLEVNLDREVVWEYVIPLSGDSPFPQGQNANNNSGFRAYKYPPNYAGFDGIDLMPGETIETGGNPLDCTLVSTKEQSADRWNIGIKYLPAENTIVINNPENINFSLAIVDVTGRQYGLGEGSSSESIFQVPNLTAGIYFVRVFTEDRHLYAEKILIF